MADHQPANATPFTHAEQYRQAGWTDTIPLPAQKKSPPPRGFTGADGAPVTRGDLDRWRQHGWHDSGAGHTPGNIALRLPPNIVGLDVDHYSDKRGGDTLAAREADWGPLPATWCTTSRTDGVSGIRLYRVPDGTAGWPTGVDGGAIEIIRHGHRYAVVGPSVHPDGNTYRWVRPDGTSADPGELPAPGQLPELPDRWVQGLTGNGNPNGHSPGRNRRQTKAHTKQWLSELPDGEPCQHVAQIFIDAQNAVQRAARCRHDDTVKHVGELANAGQVGHIGAPIAIRWLRAAFIQALGKDRKGGASVAAAEYDSIVDAAVSKVAANPSNNVGRGCNCPGPKPDGPQSGQSERTGRRVTFAKASTVKAEPLLWAWEDRIPLSAATLMVGVGGVGKSTICIDVIARATRGDLPGDLGGPVDVVLASAEDPEAEILVPRLIAAGADLDRVHFVHVTGEDGTADGLNLPSDFDLLAQQVRAVDARLVVLDPLVSYVDDNKDTHKDHHVRRVMAPFAEFASANQIGVVAVVHLNKSSETDVIRRISGSGGLANAARSVLAAGPHPRDAEQLVLLNPKANWTGNNRGQGYAIEVVPAKDTDGHGLAKEDGMPIRTTRIKWGDYLDDVDPREAPDYQSQYSAESRTTQRGRATRLLLNLLDTVTPTPVKRVEEAAKAAGVGWSTIKRAKKDLGVESFEVIDYATGKITEHAWRLPSGPPPDPGSGDSKSPESTGPNQSANHSATQPATPGGTVVWPSGQASQNPRSQAYDLLTDVHSANGDGALELGTLAVGPLDSDGPPDGHTQSSSNGWTTLLFSADCEVCHEPANTADPRSRIRHRGCELAADHVRRRHAEIRALHADGLTAHEISTRSDVPASTVVADMEAPGLSFNGKRRPAA